MNQGLKTVGIVVAAGVLLVGGVIAGSVVARARAANAAYGFMGPGMMFGQGQSSAGPNAAAGGWMYAYHGQMETALAGALNMSVDDLNKELQSGKTIGQIAQEKGLTQQQLQDAMLKAQGDILAQAVKDGNLTQAQADQILAWLKQNPGMGWGMGYRMGPGMMNGFRGDGDDYRGPGRGPGFGPGFGPNGQAPAATPTPSGTSS